ncbi:MAG: hypothetical protein KIT56_06390 [Gammaproteobacteria bacterium]|nr:hypothetical protein [Gammaproteobacteria bacterium]MCW5583493.1 hypothetical protein [Gammaproteobacteria bacterium]
MKLKTMVIGAVAIAFGLSGVAVAAGDYHPPERLHCKVNDAGNLSCFDFNRAYLVEATHTADLPPGKEVVFNFSTGTAFVTSQNEWSVFYTYIDSSFKNVRIKTISTSIRPDVQVGAWKKTKDYYSCTAGYMSCPITNLPERS